MIYLILDHVDNSAAGPVDGFHIFCNEFRMYFQLAWDWDPLMVFDPAKLVFLLLLFPPSAPGRRRALR